ncbi:MAG: hypothetical protein H6747_09775 [Deltaproteobacteria bacterium]|nr:hypothetical protein [Deltaproteobacteria bacterium]
MSEPPSSAAERAALRRRTWQGEIVETGDKGSLYATLTFQERLAAFAALNRRVHGWTDAQLSHRTPLTLADVEIIPPGETWTPTET